MQGRLRVAEFVDGGGASIWNQWVVTEYAVNYRQQYSEQSIVQEMPLRIDPCQVECRAKCQSQKTSKNPTESLNKQEIGYIEYILAL